MRKDKKDTPLIKWHFVAALLITIVIELTAFNIILFVRNLPDPMLLRERAPSLTTKIYDRNGVLLYKIYKDENRTYVPLSEISLNLINATIAIEDDTFYTHHGISAKGIIRSIKENLENDTLQGGSTITQQLVKNRLLTPEKTIKRKIKEIILALWTERIYSKGEILEMYLNEVNYGGVAYGIEEASQYYFANPSKELSLSESAMLAGLPSAPSSYSPFSDKDKARERQILVLNRMKGLYLIDELQYQKAINEGLTFAPIKTDILAPHFVMYIRSVLEDMYGKDTVERGGLNVITTLDIDIQKMAENYVYNEIENIKKYNVTNGAVLITRPATGEILAMVGSKDYFDQSIDGHFNITTAQRQPGSAIKPLMYSLALENGFTASTILYDTRISFSQSGQKPYTPVNYDGGFHGPLPLRYALGNSYNVPAVKTLNKIGVKKFVVWARSLGITTWEDLTKYGLSITLGGGEVKMLDMATSYSSFANSGARVRVNPILRVEGNFLTPRRDVPVNNNSQNVMSEGTAFIISDILADNSARSRAFGAYSKLNIPNHRVSAKTGTTNNLRDNWTIGYNKDYLVVVWVGNNDNSPMSRVVSGITGATPIWHNIMINLLKDYKEQPLSIPSDIERVRICSITGTLSCDGCPSYYEYFIKATAPKTKCSSEWIKNYFEDKKEE